MNIPEQTFLSSLVSKCKQTNSAQVTSDSVAVHIDDSNSFQSKSEATGQAFPRKHVLSFACSRHRSLRPC